MQTAIQRNNVTVTGKGDKFMILAHGFGSDQNTWRSITPAFEDDYKIVLFDYVGAGKSDPTAFDAARYSTLSGFAQDVLEICEELSIRDALFVGHSVSSMIGMLAAIQQPSYFSRLVFIGPSPRYINDEGYTGGIDAQDLRELLEVMDYNYLGWAAQLAPMVMGNPDRPHLGESLSNSFCATNPVMAKNFAKVTFWSDNRKELPKLTIKSLTLQCTDDMLAPLAVGEYIQQHTPGNDLVVLKATGHCTHLSAPGEIVEEIKKYLQRQSEVAVIRKEELVA